MVWPTPIFKSKTCIFYKNRISEVIDEIFGTTVYCHSNISMVFLFVQNFIFTVINPLIPTCKKWVIFIKFWWAPWHSLPLVASILQWDLFHKVIIVNFVKYMVNPRVGCSLVCACVTNRDMCQYFGTLTTYMAVMTYQSWHISLKQNYSCRRRITISLSIRCSCHRLDIDTTSTWEVSVFLYNNHTKEVVLKGSLQPCKD